MDVEAEFVYADILRTLQSSILGQASTVSYLHHAFAHLTSFLGLVERSTESIRSGGEH